MSSSDRNVGRNASENASHHAVPLEEFFDHRGNNAGNNAAAQAEERPNERITVRINLNQGIVPPELRDELQRNNMAIIQPNDHTDIIIISGIPPEYGFDQQQALQIVMTYVPNSELA